MHRAMQIMTAALTDNSDFSATALLRLNPVDSRVAILLPLA
jgi:hypothetical protein